MGLIVCKYVFSIALTIEYWSLLISCNLSDRSIVNTVDVVLIKPFTFLHLQAIIYEGQDKNPEMCRVLLTHEVMCR